MPPQPGVTSPGNSQTHSKDSSEKLPKLSKGIIRGSSQSHLPSFCCRVGHTLVEASTTTCSTRIQALRWYSTALSCRGSSTAHPTKTIAPLTGLRYPTCQHRSEPLSKHGTFSIPYLTTSEVPRHTSSS